MDENYFKYASLVPNKLNKTCTVYHCSVNKYAVHWFVRKDH
jgi:hypothetical protein